MLLLKPCDVKVWNPGEETKVYRSAGSSPTHAHTPCTSSYGTSSRVFIIPDYAVDRANQAVALAESGLEHDRGESDPYSGSLLHCNREPSSGKGYRGSWSIAAWSVA